MLMLVYKMLSVNWFQASFSQRSLEFSVHLGRGVLNVVYENQENQIPEPLPTFSNS